ncbi:hypothetical protein PENTCL1PPCAC_12286, partial [Pristionchus entomophagus]
IIKAAAAAMENRQVFHIPRDASALPNHDATIHPAHPFLKFQTILDAEKRKFPISEEEYMKASNSSTNYARAIIGNVSGAIDPATCRTLDQGWAIGWKCETCGCYKYSDEMTTSFLRGAAAMKQNLEQNEIYMKSAVSRASNHRKSSKSGPSSWKSHAWFKLEE